MTTDVRSPYALVFVDSSVRDHSTLIESIAPNAEVIVFGGSSDGVAQISAALADRSSISAIHIVSHGADGELQLGAASLSTATLPAYSDAISGWSAALAPGADILLYGCNVAQGPIGQAFVQKIASLTSANVAASMDTTGAAALGGNWALEYETGSIQAVPVIPASVAYHGVLSVERFATLSWTRDLTAHSDPLNPTVTIDFDLEAGFRADYPWGAQGFVVGGPTTATVANGGIHVGTILEAPGSIDTLSFGDGTILSDANSDPQLRPYFEVTQIIPVLNVIYGRLVTEAGQPVTHTYAAPAAPATTASYVVDWNGTTRQSLSNDAFHDQPWQTETIVDIAPNVTKSPVVTSLPIISFSDNAVNHFQLSGVTFDNDVGVWRLGTAAEFIADQTAAGFPLQFNPSSAVAPAGLTLSSDGMLTWDLLDADNPGVVPGYYTVTAMLQEVSPSDPSTIITKVPYDFLIQVVANTGHQPLVFDTLPPLANTVLFGTPQDFVIHASESDAASVFINNTPLPDGMTLTQPVGGEVHIHFDPTLAEIGQSSLVVFQAESFDSNSNVLQVSQQVSIIFTVDTPPVVQTNAGATDVEGGTITIGTTALNVTDAQQDASLLTYSLAALPTHGQLLLNGVALTTSDTFTQSNIDANQLTYQHDGSETTSDAFLFSVSDGVGGSTAQTSFAITVLLNDHAPVITTAATQSVAENTTFVAALTSTDVDAAGTNPADFSISGGANAAAFDIVNGDLVFKVAPDYETDPHSYQVEVTANDGLNTSSELIDVSVTDVLGVTITGTNGADIVDATHTVPGQPLPTPEADVIMGGSGNDTLHGLGGNDIITGGAGRDAIYGDDGDDTLIIEHATDVAKAEIYDGGAGNDTLQFLNPDGAADLSNSTITNVENISGFADGVSMTLKQLIGFTGTVDTGDITLTTSGALQLLSSGFVTRSISLANVANSLTIADSAVVSHVVNGGSLTDVVHVTDVSSGQGVTIYGNGGDDLLYGGAADDVLAGGAGLDKLYGQGGNDVLLIQHASDVVHGEIYDGGAGSDTLQFLNADAGVDLSGTTLRNIESISGFTDGISMTLAELTMFTGTIDTGDLTFTTSGVVKFSTVDLLTQTIDLSGASNNSLSISDSSSVSHVVSGGGLSDTVHVVDAAGGLGVTIHGNGGDDHLYGGSAADTLTGDAGNDTLYGGGGNDTLTGGAGLDHVYGQAGNDIIAIQQASDVTSGEVYDGGVGDDTLQFDNADASVDLTGVSIANIENIVGFADGVSMTRAELLGFTGTIDTGDITLASAGTTDLSGLDLLTKTIDLSNAGNNRVTISDSASVGHIVNGGTGNDAITVTGSAGLGVTLNGGAGSDHLTGGLGNDTLNGGAGTDVLTGGGGDDTFAFNAGEANRDTVVDFMGIGDGGHDQLQFMGYALNATFTEINATHWQVADATHQETITFSNAAHIVADDLHFI